MVLPSGPKNASQGTVDWVREVRKNALQTLETGITDIGLVLCGTEAQDTSVYFVSSVTRRTLRSFYHV